MGEGQTLGFKPEFKKFSSVCPRVFQSVYTDVTECRQSLVGSATAANMLWQPRHLDSPPLGANSLLGSGFWRVYGDVYRRAATSSGDMRCHRGAVNVRHLTMSRATFATMNVQLPLRYLSSISRALFIALLSSGIMWRHLGHQRRQKYS